MHTDWINAIGLEFSLKVRFEVVHEYLRQHCFFLLLPQVLVRIQNAAAASKKTKDPGLHKGNTGSQTLD